MPQPLQHQSSNAVARRRGIVRTGFEADDQLLMIRAGEEKSTGWPIFVTRQQRPGQTLRKVYVFQPEPRLNELQQRSDHKSMIIQVGIQMRAAVLVGG